MGSMTNEEYASRFLELLRYMPYLKEEKENIKRFITGLSVEFKDMIEFDEPRCLEEAIQKLSIVMRNQSAYLRLSQTQKVMQRINENGTTSEQDLKIKVT